MIRGVFVSPETRHSLSARLALFLLITVYCLVKAQRGVAGIILPPLEMRMSMARRGEWLALPMVFPVVMYGCESWTVKKAERPRIDAFEL